MRRCDDCKIILDDDVRHCPKCGKNLSQSTPAPRQTDGDISSLLASANLHKIRAEWDEAIADCTEALRADPRNPDIASLLGGIYEERGMLDEALVWYQMALELNPDNGPDQDRLERVTKLTETKREHRDAASFRAFERRTKIWAVVLGTVFAVIVIVAIVTTLMRNKATDSVSTKPTRPTHSQGFTPPINDSETPLAQGPQAPGSQTTPPTSGGSTVRTAGESYIRSELASTQSVTETGATIDDVTADPRSGVVSITFAVPFKGFVTKEQIIRAAIAVSRKSFDLNREVKFVTTRCVIQTGGAQGSQIAFVGDIARQTIDALSPTATNEQLTAAFSRPWWNPQIK